MEKVGSEPRTLGYRALRSANCANNSVVIQGYTVAILLKAVRILWDDNNGILLTKMAYQKYELVYTSMYYDIDGM